MAVIERDPKGRFQRVTPAVVGRRIKPRVTALVQRDTREVRRVVYTTRTER